MKTRGLLLLVIIAPWLPCQTKPHDGDAMAQQSVHENTYSVVVPVDYVIGPSDVLSVAVWKEPGLSTSLLVRPDGMVSLPLLGDVAASGLKPVELAELITNKLKKYFQDPNVSVVLTQINSRKVYLLGEIAKKGPVEMSSGMRLIEAISTAGGLTDYANTKKMYILRSEGGTQHKIPVHYKEALKGNTELNVPLKPGDTIVVP